MRGGQTAPVSRSWHPSTRLILVWITLLGALAVSALSGLELPPVLPRRWHLFLHVLGAVMFVGNILAGAVWMARLGVVSSHQLDARPYASVSFNIGDVALTAPGACLLLYNGLVLAAPFGGAFGQPWLSWSSSLFGLLFLLWALVLVPLQQHLIHLALTGQRAAFDRWTHRYSFPGIVAASLALISLGLMVIRPN